MRFAIPSLAAAAVVALAAPLAHAGGTTIQLVRVGALTNIDDAAGRWQHEGGNVFKGGVKIGQYAIHRRVTTNGTTSPLNTAMTTITLFLATAGGSAPNNITLQGAHDFTSGGFRGSVSAASNRYTWIQGADASYTASSGTINLSMSWAGASQLVLP